MGALAREMNLAFSLWRRLVRIHDLHLSPPRICAACNLIFVRPVGRQIMRAQSHRRQLTGLARRWFAAGETGALIRRLVRDSG